MIYNLARLHTVTVQPELQVIGECMTTEEVEEVKKFNFKAVAQAKAKTEEDFENAKKMIEDCYLEHYVRNQTVPRMSGVHLLICRCQI